MKIGKKILTAILMMAVMVGMGLAAFAGETSDTYSITITNVKASHAYTAYQIFKGDVSEGSIGNIEWGSGLTSRGKDTIYSYYGLTDADQTAAKVAASIASFNTGSSAATEDDAKAVDFANIIPKTYIYNYLQNGKRSTYDADDKTATISGLDPGYYLVIDSQEPTSDSASSNFDYSLSRRMVQLVGEDVIIKNKVVQPTVDKKIVVDDEDKTETVAAIGETVDFKITSSVPNCEGFQNYVMTFDDTLSRGLTLDEDSIVVKVGETTLTKDTDYSVTVGPHSAAYGEAEVYANGATSIQIKMKIKENNGDQKYTFGEPITITYGAELNGNASIVGFEGKKTSRAYTNSIGPNYNGNRVRLIYSNNPNSDSTGQTRWIEARVWTYEFQIVKTKNLENYYWYIDTVNDARAEFRLYEDEACTREIKLVQGVSHADAWATNGGESNRGSLFSPVYRPMTKEEIEKGTVGVVIKAGHPYVSGLNNGTYYLKETKAPEGYTLMSPNPRKITISDRSIDASFLGPYNYNNTDEWRDTSKTHFSYENGSPDGGGVRRGHYYTYDYSTGGIHVIDEAGSVLPSTGGIGTTIFYVIGAVLVIGAGVLLVTRKRTDAVK